MKSENNDSETKGSSCDTGTRAKSVSLGESPGILSGKGSSLSLGPLP